jgi:hypothetical protein
MRASMKLRDAYWLRNYCQDSCSGSLADNDLRPVVCGVSLKALTGADNAKTPAIQCGAFMNDPITSLGPGMT